MSISRGLEIRYKVLIVVAFPSVMFVLKGLSLLYYFLICVIRLDKKSKEIKHTHNM